VEHINPLFSNSKESEFQVRDVKQIGVILKKKEKKLIVEEKKLSFSNEQRQVNR